MMNVFKSIGLAAAITLAPLAASAATLSLVGSGYVDLTLANNDLGFDGDTISYLSGAVKDPTNGLSVDEDVFVTYTYLGFEAGNANKVVLNSTEEFIKNVTSINAVSSTFVVTSGLLDFAFQTTAPANSIGNLPNDGTPAPINSNYAIGYLKISDTSFYAFFDDIAGGDRDFDDIAIRIDIAPVPLPAGGLLLLSGLAGAAALRRRKKAA